MINVQKALFCVVAVSVFASLGVWVGCVDNNVAGTVTGGYTLTVSANPPSGGSVSRDGAQTSYSAGTSVTVTAEANPGYEFIGWAGASVSTDNSVTVTMDDNLMLIADFKHLSDSKRRFTVSFNTNGGTPDTIGHVAVESGSAMGTQFPANPTRIGYDFDGWFEGKTQYVLSTVINKNVTLTAGWTKKRFTVTFNTNGGAPSAINPVTVDSGGVAGASFPANPTRTGYDFSAWFDGETGTVYTARTAVTEDVTLIAEWTAAAAIEAKRFTVSFNTNGGIPSAVSPISVDSGSMMGTNFPANPTRMGYNFVGWFDASAQYAPGTAIAKDVMLVAEWAIKSYTVSFDANGGSQSVVKPVTVDSGSTLGANFPASPTRAGCAFIGWFDASEQYMANTAITKAVTLMAKWSIKSYTVTFDVNGGTPSAISLVTVDSGGTMGTNYPANPTKMGYVFGGWFDASVQYSSSTAITANVMLTAKWATRSYTVSFDANGGNSSAISSVTVDSGAAMGANFPASPTKMGYDFGGWFDGAAQYTSGTVIVKDVTLTAKWEAKRYTVSFDANGGVLGAASSVIVDSGGTMGTNFPSNATMIGHDFVGWFEGLSQYTSGTVITKDVKLTARWTIKRYVVSFNVNGGDTGTIGPFSTDSATVLVGFPASIKRAEHYFYGWFDGSERYTEKTPITRNVALTAVWVPVVLADNRDGKRYKTAMIGRLVFMAENLNYESSKTATDTSWCYGDNNTNCVTYGRLYNVGAAKKACPSGWHVASENDMAALLKVIDTSHVKGKRLKSKTGWSNGGDGTDDFGFTALPGGYREEGQFLNVGIQGYWWFPAIGWTPERFYYMSSINDDVVSGTGKPRDGYSIRCVVNDP